MTRKMDAWELFAFCLWAMTTSDYLRRLGEHIRETHYPGKYGLTIDDFVVPR